MTGGTVQRISAHLNAMQAPAALRDLPGWLLWREEPNPGQPKPRKVPYYIDGTRRHGVQGRPDDALKLVTFEQAKAAAIRRGFGGLGFALLRQFGITGWDADNCIDNDGNLDPRIANLFSDTYVEVSPSGHGVHAFYKGFLPNAKDLAGDFPIEVFSSSGYLTFTGQHLLGSEDDAIDLSQPVLDLYQARFGHRTAPSASPVHVSLEHHEILQALAAIPPEVGYQEWISVGMAIHNATDGKGFDLWDEWSARASGDVYPGTGTLKGHWRSFSNSKASVVTGRSLIALANRYGAGMGISPPASADEFEILVEEAEQVDAPSRFPVIPAAEFSNRPPPSWIVKGLLPQAELAIVYGASGAGKSFVALDLAASIARGIPWRGRKVRQGKVVYIAAEGAGGFRNRLKAYAQHHDIQLEDLDIGVIHAAPNLILRQDAVDVARSIQASGGADVIIVDTFAQVTPGANENAGEDMGQALAHCKGMHMVCNATIVLIHHAGKDASRGARGWSGLKAAADAELEVVRADTGRMLRVTKQKDGDDGEELGFDLKQVTIGTDEDLDPITSCVVIEAAVPSPDLKPVKGATEKAIMQAAKDLCEATGETTVDELIELVASRLPLPDGTRDRRKEKVARSIAGLERSGHLFVADGQVSIC